LLTIVLVRHGETGFNKDRRIQGGGSDTPLNETGIRQKELVAARLKTGSYQAIYSSPLLRAVDTARAIARYHNLEVINEPGLREIDMGEFEGVQAIEKLGRHMAEILTMGPEGEKVPAMPGGESLAQVQSRVCGALQRLVAKHPEGSIVVVSHFFAILTVICNVLGMPVSQIARFRMTPGSISIVVYDSGNPRLLSFNDSGHLVGI
jgi:probable phosphoglycerate mutase